MARQVIATGQKGGVGKTTFSLVLANWLADNGIAWSGIDTDLANQTFESLGGGRVQGVSLYEKDGSFVPSEMNAIVDNFAAMSASAETIIVDVGAGQLEALVTGMRSRRLLGTEAVLQTTIAYVVLQDYASVSTLSNLVDIADGLAGVSWLIVQNERDGPVTRYTNSKTRQELLQRGAAEMTIPALKDPAVLDALRTAQVTVAEFCNPANGHAWSIRGQLITWLAATSLALNQHRDLFCASAAAVTQTDESKKAIAV